MTMTVKEMRAAVFLIDVSFRSSNAEDRHQFRTMMRTM